jgi:uncharacterized membrane protein YhhN
MRVELSYVCALACGALVYAEYVQHRRWRIVAKLLASTAFVLIGTAAFEIDGDPARVRFGQTIALGLVLGAVGDAALLGTSSRAFLTGLVAFLLGHLAYVAAAGTLVPPTDWLAAAGIQAAVPVVIGLAATVWLWPHLGSMRIPVLGYVVTIVTMVIAALAVARAGALPAPHDLRFAVGAALFFVSDLAVARDRFVVHTFANRAWGLPTYYAGQLLIAWSIVDL